MSLAVYKTFSAGEVLTAADLNASLTNFTNNALALISPLTGALDCGAFALNNAGVVSMAQAGVGVTPPSYTVHAQSADSHTIVGTSGAANKFAALATGRTTAEVFIGICGAVSNFLNTTLQGDGVVSCTSGTLHVGTTTANAIIFVVNQTEVGRFSNSSGNFGVGATTFGASAAKVLGLGNATAPTTSPAAMGQLYVESGALKYRGSSGTVTTIAVA